MHRSGHQLRLFFALQPVAVLSELVESAAPLVAQLRGQQVPAENLHATLCFIGATAPEDLAKLRDVAARQQGRCVTLRFDSLDFWQKPRILCAIPNDESGSAAAHTLAANLANATRDAGFTPDARDFRAHLTLARKISAPLAAQVEWPRSLAPMTLDFDRFVLIESRRGESGSTYSVVDSWPLYAADTD